MSNTKVVRYKQSSLESSLYGFELFKGVPYSCLQMIENRTTVRKFEIGHVFYRPGELGEAMFLLENGAVQTFRICGGKKLIVTELKPPAVFGEMGCLGQCIYHCCAQTTEVSEIRTISKDLIETLLESFPFIAHRLVDILTQRFAKVLLDLEATSFQLLVPRLASLLLARADNGCLKGLTHKDIAEHLRVYRESATAALGELKKAGIIAVERKQIRIVDHARLMRAARESR
jgi:CRP/FNR family transcriptional regulator, cyclic AMP receptor protein